MAARLLSEGNLVETARAGASDLPESFETKAQRLRREALSMSVAPDSIRIFVFERLDR